MARGAAHAPRGAHLYFFYIPPPLTHNVILSPKVRDHLLTTHASELLASRAESFASLLVSLVKGDEPAAALAAAAKAVSLDLPSMVKRAKGDDSAVVGRQFSTACYITDSWPSVLYLAAAHLGDFEAAVLANTNLGGENAHRGSALGAVMGASAFRRRASLEQQRALLGSSSLISRLTRALAVVGESNIPAHLKDGLADSAAIKAEIDAFVAAVVAPAPPAAAMM